MSVQEPKGTDGRVFGGDSELIHVANGTRKDVGKDVADFIDLHMRDLAFKNGSRTIDEASDQGLCPGCFMIVGVNSMLELAKRNHFSPKSLSKTMALFWMKIHECEDWNCIEEIQVELESIGEEDDSDA